MAHLKVLSCGSFNKGHREAPDSLGQTRERQEKTITKSLETDRQKQVTELILSNINPSNLLQWTPVSLPLCGIKNNDGTNNNTVSTAKGTLNTLQNLEKKKNDLR